MRTTNISRRTVGQVRTLILSSCALSMIVPITTSAQAQAPNSAPAVPVDAGPGTPSAAAMRPSAAPSPAAPQAGGLEDIVVTARKRSESVQNIPVAVTAFSAADIQKRDLTSLERIAAATPQLAIGRNASGSGAQITLRGIGSNSLSIGTEQSVAVIVDGVYYGQGRAINEGFFDLAGVEVLKGPQSLFYGKNATAGVISITTAGPTDHFTAMARGGYEFNAKKPYGEAVVSGPITDRLGFRVAVRGSKDFGNLFTNTANSVTYNTRNTPTATTVATPTPHTEVPTKDGGPRERDFLARATLKWEVTDRLTATIKGNYGRNKTRPGSWNLVVFSCPNGVSSTSPGVACERDFTTHTNNMPAEIAQATRYANSTGSSFNDYESWGTTVTLDYALDNMSITSVNNYFGNHNHWSNDLDYQSSPTVNIWGAELSKYRAFSSENRLLSKFDGPLNFLAGGYYQSTHLDFGQVVLNNGSENSAAPEGYRYVTYSKQSKTAGETLSAYGQLIWKVVPGVEATAGVRYIHETKDSSFVTPYANPRFANIIYAVDRPILANQTFNNWSPEATITWKPVSNVTLYGAYKTAYKSGGFSNSSIESVNTPADFFTFDPEKARGFEGGIKTTLLDRQLRLNIAAYTYRYSNLQVTYLDAAILSYNSINAGSVRTRGVEAEFEFAPRAIAGLNVKGSLNYNKARYGNAIAPCYTGQHPDQGCVANLLSTGTPGQNLKGLPTSDAPLWTAGFGAEYEHTIGERFVLGGGFDGKYSASYLSSPFGAPLSRQPKYVTLDATLRLATSDGQWELAVLGKNLTNRFIVTGVQDASNTGSGTGTFAGRAADQVGQVALPRTVALQLTWKMR